jgi:hypothetical protein
LVITGEGWLSLEIDSLMTASSGDSIILAIQFGSPAEAAACSLEIPDAWDAITNIRSRVCPITDGAWIRTLIWLDRGEGFTQPVGIDRTVKLHIKAPDRIILAGIYAEHLKNIGGH